MLLRRRIVVALSLTGALLSASPAVCQAGTAQVKATSPRANSHLDWCNRNAVKTAPSVFWSRVHAATDVKNSGISSKFWSDVTYRDDIAKVVCYESSFEYHANGGGQYGWFQMSSSLISSENVTFDEYWHGTKTEGAGWYQCLAGERYITAAYGTPAGAWAHEEQYGWY